MRKTLLITALTLASTVSFASVNSIDAKWVVGSIETKEVKLHSQDLQGSVDAGSTTGETTGGEYPPEPRTMSDKVQDVGSIITIARDIVALGEDIYKLVSKGKPTNITEYAPISVVPRIPGTNDYIDPFELENFSMPVDKKFVTSIKNGTGSEVVRFEYMVIFSHSGSYNGTGHYLTAVQVVPVSVKTSFGWDFNATMKLGGIMNNGSKDSPVAGLNLGIKYQMNSWSSAFERNEIIYINGKGEIKAYTR